MINKARTLLLNRSGSATGYLNRPGEEFIEPSFRTIERLPGYLVAARRVLFGSQPDWLFENYRMRQYMSVLHSTELVEFVTQLDPRITYDVDNDDFFQGTFGTTFNAPDIQVMGQPPSPDENGQAIRKWRLRILDGTTVRIKNLVLGTTVDRQFATTGQWSVPLELGGPDCLVMFKVEVGREWDITQQLRPQRSLGEIVDSLTQTTARYGNDLFGISNVEPWLTFRNLWTHHHQLPYRLGGYLLAVIHRTEERRVSSG